MNDADFFRGLLADVQEKQRELLGELMRAQLLEREIRELVAQNENGETSRPPRS